MKEGECLLLKNEMVSEIMEAEEKKENPESDKMCFWRTKEKIEENPEVRERLVQKGVEKIDLSNVKDIWQFRIAEAVETMYEAYPEMENFIKSIRTENLPEGVFACAGPRMTKEGFFTEILLNKEMFAKSNLELKIVDCERENFKGEKWLAGRGVEGVLKHEMAHLMHLRLLAKEEHLMIGDSDLDKYQKVVEGYQRNYIMSTMCYEALQELGISPRDIGKNLSTYGATNFGECFAEAISEYETTKSPRILAKTIHEKYQNLLKEGKS